MTSYFTKTANYPNSDEQIEIDVRYDLGGVSWYHGQTRPRGIKVSFTPIRIEQHAGYQSRQYRLGDDRGRAFHVVDLKRKNAKQGEKLAKYVEENFSVLSDLAILQDWKGIASILFAYK